MVWMAWMEVKEVCMVGVVDGLLWGKRRRRRRRRRVFDTPNNCESMLAWALVFREFSDFI